MNETHIDDPFNEFLQKNSIRHLRIPLRAPWFGHAWERLLRVVKGCIYKCIGRKRLDYFEFSSLLADIQNSVNSRPLTYNDESSELDYITPNNLLKVFPSPTIDFGNLSESDLKIPSRKAIVSTLSKRQEIFETFRDMWYEYYLLSLREHSQDQFEEKWVNKIEVGDVVLISSPTKSRNMWNMGRITQLLPGKDGKVRTVKLRRSTSHDDETYPINLLYPLELSLITNN